MYLKSLALKGFKSFADRCSMVLQPGITAIVGPNGSGKSNICDAVLWVLGERNAKHLRGQAMEDVVFAGSATRKAAGYAEVELILDNSDRTIPVDYAEVALTRRLYRTGENEYLINGIVARRLDVLDILHDSGLGTDTHSIISQGALDQILRSKPEDRRMLIEEAAGVLKHKQRKEKSARKLQQMENHLARVRDVTAEISRQLGPLERKASRAKRYDALSAELAEVSLALAVDDLINLQKEWDDILQKENALARRADEQRGVLQEAQARFDALQEKLRIDHIDAGELNRNQRRIADVLARYEKALLLVGERQRAYQTRAEAAHDEIMRLEEVFSASREGRAQAELGLREAKEEHDIADKQLAELDASDKELKAALHDAEEALGKAAKELGSKRIALEETQRTLMRKQDEQTNVAARLEAAKAQKDDISRTLHEAEEAAQNAEKAFENAQNAETTRGKEAEQARRFFEESSAACAQYERALRDAQELKSRLAAQIQGLEQAQWTARSTDAAASAWLLSDEGLKASFKPLSKYVKTEQSLEFLVEQLLGNDLEALLVESAQSARKAAEALALAGQTGFATLLITDESSSQSLMSANDEADDKNYLYRHLSCPKDSRAAVMALLGNVVLCGSLDEALTSHEKDKKGLCFATPQGEIVWPSGKVCIGSRTDDHEGTLGVERRIDDLSNALAQAQEEERKCEAEAAQARDRKAAAEEARIEADRLLAEARGAKSAASESLRQAKGRLEASQRDLQRIEQRCSSSASELAAIKEVLDATEPQLEKCREEVEQARRSQREQEQAIAPLREKALALDEGLSRARLQTATLKERLQYLRKTFENAAQDLERQQKQRENAHSSKMKAEQAAKRLSTLPAIVEKLRESLSLRSLALEHAANLAEEASASAYHQAASGQKELQRARDELDATTEKLSELRVEKGRLEMRVHSAVNTIEQDCATPLDAALQIGPLEERAEAEEKHATLARRIANLGTINPDAAAEYDALKLRYDFLAGQLADLEEAKRSLAKITHAIDGRLKDDFIETFHAVNKNFKEIFSTLFPGGEAYLILDDPDDIENTGIEVKAQPRGKRITKMSLLSGGEKSLTALALLFAIYKTRATPFYILDEVEAALDDTNLRRFIAYLGELRETTQLILITHQRRTMEMADVLFGVSMHGDGVTKVLSQKLAQNR